MRKPAQRFPHYPHAAMTPRPPAPTMARVGLVLRRMTEVLRTEAQWTEGGGPKEPVRARRIGAWPCEPLDPLAVRFTLAGALERAVRDVCDRTPVPAGGESPERLELATMQALAACFPGRRCLLDDWQAGRTFGQVRLLIQIAIGTLPSDPPPPSSSSFPPERPSSP